MPREPDEATSVSTSAAPLAITDGEAKAEAVSSETSVSALASITYDPKPISQVDIGSVISKRLRAMRELQDNPDSVTAKENLETATIEVDNILNSVGYFISPAHLLFHILKYARQRQDKVNISWFVN
jgi:hypothetical protein